MKALAERAFRIMSDLLILFIALNIFNVIIQTIKNIATISCSKFPAALLNSFAYGFHTIVTIYMLCDLPLYLKALVVALCNLVGVYFVKWGEEKARKDKLWKVEATIPHRYSEALIKLAEEQEMSFNYVDIKKYTEDPYVETSNSFSNLGYNLGTTITDFFSVKLVDFFEFIGKFIS